MIIIEKCLPELMDEMTRLTSSDVGPNGRMFVLGALHAIEWIKSGGIPPSQSNFVIPNAQG